MPGSGRKGKEGYGFLFDYAMELLGVLTTAPEDCDSMADFMAQVFLEDGVSEHHLDWFVDACLDPEIIEGGELTETVKESIARHQAKGAVDAVLTRT